MFTNRLEKRAAPKRSNDDPRTLGEVKEGYVSDFTENGDYDAGNQDAMEEEEKQDADDEDSYESDSSDAEDQTVKPYALKPFAYADLWAPLRFAVPATHTFEEECSAEHLEGDSVRIGEGRMGPVYRKTMQGYDCAVKLLVYSCEKEIDDLGMVYPTFLRDEMRNERDMYFHLEDLQGKHIPRLLWHGVLLRGVADALVTEYAGEPLPENPSKLQIDGAIAALQALHDRGIAHGDVELKNFVCKGDHVMILDLGFSIFKSDFDGGDAKWEKMIKYEMHDLKSELGLVAPRYRGYSSSSDESNALVTNSDGATDEDFDTYSKSRKRVHAEAFF